MGDMDVGQLKAVLAGLSVPQVRYYDVIGSTNDEAIAWAAAGAEDGCLVVADQQTQGRGRLGRRWVTHPGAALAFSLVMRPTPGEIESLGFFSPLGALAICQALEERLGLKPQIKWPNDVLLERRKAAGILVEAAWSGQQLQGIVVGIGLNIKPEAVPPADQLLFPAISVEEAASLQGSPRNIARWDLLRSILQALFFWRGRLSQEGFRQAWEERLAFRQEWVRIETASGQPGSTAITGQIIGIDASGNLLLMNAAGQITPVAVGDVHLRPIQ